MDVPPCGIHNPYLGRCQEDGRSSWQPSALIEFTVPCNNCWSKAKRGTAMRKQAAPAVILLILVLIVAGIACDGEETTPTPVPTGSASIEMVSIPGGSSEMGSFVGDLDEQPVHTVTLSPFYASKYETTFEQWVEVRDWGEAHGYTFNSPGDMGSEDYGGAQDESHPVTNIEWYDSLLWCNALSEMEGRTPCYHTSAARSTVYRSGRLDPQSDWVDWSADGYRLPTEAEWEYGARGGIEGKAYGWGNDFPVCRQGASNGAQFNDSECNAIGTSSAGSYSENGYGLYDTAGNVWEWCWDRYSITYYDSSPTADPRGPSEGTSRVARGGSWGSNADALRSANRYYFKPDYGASDLGFRVVRSD